MGLTNAEKEVKYLRNLVRRLIKEAWSYADHENCVFCEGDQGSGFVNDRKHALDCVGNEARKHLENPKL